MPINSLAAQSQAFLSKPNRELTFRASHLLKFILPHPLRFEINSSTFNLLALYILSCELCPLCSLYDCPQLDQMDWLASVHLNHTCEW
jgi:hypothetical protein